MRTGGWSSGQGGWSPGQGRGSGAARNIKPETSKRVIRLFSPYRLQIGGIVVSVLLSAALQFVRPFLLRNIVDGGLIAHNMSLVTRLALLTIAVSIGSIGFQLVFSYISILVGQSIMQDIRNKLYSHLQSMSLRFFTSTRTGEIQSRLANDVSGVQTVVSDTVANLLNNITTVIGTLIAMVILDWRLTLLSVGVMPLFAFLGGRVGEMARKVRTTTQERLADMNSTMQETLSVSGILLTKTSGRQLLSLARFQSENEALTRAQIRLAVIMRAFFNVIGLSFTITPALVYWLAGFLIIMDHSTQLTLGTLIAFTSLQAMLFFPLQSLSSTQVELMSALALFDRIFEYLDKAPDIVDSADATVLDPHQVRGAVGFKNVVFRYEPDQLEPTLRNIDFDAKPGDLVALVGHSGAGKTTLTYLIPRLYDPDQGSITIDGVDIRKIKLSSLGSLIGVVTQETYLVHDTIRENLRYGNPDAGDDELIAAAKVAAIHDHIASLPAGYDTVVGERGYKLSGGEKQRIAIARAVLKDPRILILDEATSALDTQSERLIQSALEPLMHGRTTFAIAHRISTILAANLILVMQEGAIVESGNHDELLAHGGVYARLYEAQFVNKADQELAPA